MLCHLYCCTHSKSVEKAGAPQREPAKENLPPVEFGRSCPAWAPVGLRIYWILPC